MKANAPEKIYLHIRPNKEIGSTWHGNKIIDTDIEYVRKDAFIEKAAEWLQGFMEFSSLFEYEVSESEKKTVIEDFRKYMEGE